MLGLSAACTDKNATASFNLRHRLGSAHKLGWAALMQIIDVFHERFPVFCRQNSANQLITPKTKDIL
jgi:hypothetical protein